MSRAPGWRRPRATWPPRVCIDANVALDAACFHCQQAAEKFLKGYLVARETQFPFVHDLETLVDLCLKSDSRFERIRADAEKLTPFAVQLRYSSRFWPTKAEAELALKRARDICDFVEERWPQS